MSETGGNNAEGSDAVGPAVLANSDVVDTTAAVFTGIPFSPKASGINKETATSVAQLSEKSAPVSRRPVTRSLSGRPAKRQILQNNIPHDSTDDAADHASEVAPARKKQKTTRRTRKSVAAVTSRSSQPHTASHDSPSPLATPADEIEKDSVDSPSEASSSSNLHPASLAGTSLIATRIGTKRAMRATLPTPVPNLTKKSRGRRVPVRVITTTGAEIISDPLPLPGGSTSPTSGSTPKEKRSYVCSVEGCGKCFYRGEHLKRHIRSIHTHEKPFKCTYPDCDKHFNRHDNLLQHLKVHKQAQATAAMTVSGPVVLHPTGKTKGKGKSKGRRSASDANSTAKSGGGRGRGKRKRVVSEDEEDDNDNGSGDDESSVASEESDADEQHDEASAVTNLLSLRASLKGAPTLITPLHHNLTSSYAPTISTVGSISSTGATVVGSGSNWEHQTSNFSGTKPYSSLYAPSFAGVGAHHSDGHKSYNPLLQSQAPFSLSKSVYDSDVLHRPNGYRHHHAHMLRHEHGHGHDMVREDPFQYNMAMSSLRSTNVSNLKSGDGNEKKDGEGPNGGMEADSENMNGRGHVGHGHPSNDMFKGLTYHHHPHPTGSTNGRTMTGPGDSQDVPYRTGGAPGPIPPPTNGVHQLNGDDSTSTGAVTTFLNGANASTTMSSLASRMTLRPVESEQDWRD